MNIKKKLTLTIIFITCLLSTGTFFLIFNYLDPYEHTILALSVLSISFVMSISSFSSLCIYFFKKIYYRGEVYLFHIIHSFRQGFFIALFFIGAITFKIIGAPLIISTIALLMLLVFVEVFIQDLFQ